MQFPTPLVPGRLARRYKRFLADVVLDDSGETVVAHCANPGSMLGLAEVGSRVWLAPAAGAGRKLVWSWELVEAGAAATLVGINTGRANTLVAEAMEASRIAEVAGYDLIRREVRYGAGSRVDFLLQRAGKPDCFLEVKSVTLRRGDGPAEFPDAVTARGTRHLAELAQVARDGGRAVLLFLVQRADCAAVTPAGDIDPAYAAALAAAKADGVEILCYNCRITPAAIALDVPLPFHL